MRTRKPGPSAALRVLALLLAGTLLAGCGDEPDAATDGADPGTGQSAGAEASEPSPSDPSAASGAREPRCDDVWVDGATLPGGYDGCYDGDAEVAPQGRPCSFGKVLLTHDDRFWSVRGGRITESNEAQLLDDRRYRTVLENCSG